MHRVNNNTVGVLLSAELNNTHVYLHSAMSMNMNALCKKASNHHANLPLEMYSFTL